MSAPRRGPGAPPRQQPAVRVQRPTSTLPVVHLEAEIPSMREWRVSIDGLVGSPVAVTMDELAGFGVEERTWDFHCVWGWSRPECRWSGVPVSRLLARARPQPSARFAFVGAAAQTYASCLSLEELSDSLFALSLDGRTLDPEHGGPVRLVPPPRKWAYKGVKWVSTITLTAGFTPGPWETLVGNPHGDIATELLDLRFEP